MQFQNHTHPLLTIKEVATCLRGHRATISSMISTAELPCIRVRSRKLSRMQDLQAFIDNQTGMAGESSLEANHGYSDNF